jgi:hypothetical protein
MGTHEISLEDDVRLAFCYFAQNYFIANAVSEEYNSSDIC